MALNNNRRKKKNSRVERRINENRVNPADDQRLRLEGAVDPSNDFRCKDGMDLETIPIQPFLYKANNNNNNSNSSSSSIFNSTYSIISNYDSAPFSFWNRPYMSLRHRYSFLNLRQQVKTDSSNRQNKSSDSSSSA